MATHITSESPTGHSPIDDMNPFCSACGMGELSQKSEYVEYIKRNFGKISQRQIASRLHVGKTTVNRWSAEVGLKYRKFEADESFFDTWTEDSAYLLGYIFADGNVAWNTEKSYYALTITAAAKDMHHLERMRTLLRSTKPLVYSEKTRSYRLIVNSKRLCAQLMDAGVIPRKSLCVAFPSVPSSFMRHFIRGVVDGDGTVYYLNRKRSPYLTINVYSGSRRFIEGIVSAIKYHAGVDCNIRLQAKNVYVAQYTCARAKRLCAYLYGDSHIFLERKFQQYRISTEGKNGNESMDNIGKRD